MHDSLEYYDLDLDYKVFLTPLMLLVGLCSGGKD